jgi:hypothetical protein
MSHENYTLGLCSLTGISDAPLTQDDRSAINQALGLLDADLLKAQSIKTQNGSWWERAKSAVTDVPLDAINHLVDTFASAVQAAHVSAAKILGNKEASHADAEKFLKFAVDIENDLDTLKVETNRNQLGTLASEVGKATATELAHKTESIVKSGLSALWDGLSTPGKVAVGVGGVVAVVVAVVVVKKEVGL